MKVYANIERAHLEIAYDNGGIHRFRTENEATDELRRFRWDTARCGVCGGLGHEIPHAPEDRP